MKRISLFSLFVLLLLPTSACKPQELSIKDAWARPGNQGAMGAAYFVIENPTGQDDELLLAESDIAENVEMHISTMKDDGTMTMIQQASIPVPANSTVELKPGGLHIMLIGLREELRPDDTFNLSLQFKNAGVKEMEVSVRNP